MGAAFVVDDFDGGRSEIGLDVAEIVDGIGRRRRQFVEPLRAQRLRAAHPDDGECQDVSPDGRALTYVSLGWFNLGGAPAQSLRAGGTSGFAQLAVVTRDDEDAGQEQKLEQEDDGQPFHGAPLAAVRRRVPSV